MNSIAFALNEILGSLLKKERVTIPDMLTTLYTDDKKRLSVLSSLEKKASKLGKSTGDFTAILGTLEEVMDSAFKDTVLSNDRAFYIDLLKQNNRIAQHGQGKGKAVILLDFTGFNITDKIEGLHVQKNDTASLASALSENVTSLMMDVELLQAKIKKLETDLAESKSIIKDLKAELSTQAQRTWG